MTGDVIQFVGRNAQTEAPLSKTDSEFLIESDRPSQAKRFVDTSKLYPDEQSGQFSLALRFIREASINAETSLECIRSGDNRGADNEIMLLTSALAKLFSIAENVGDSFGTIVLAAFHALKNRGEGLLNADQMNAIAYSLRKLDQQPMMSYETALELTSQMEDAGLNLESADFKHISNLLQDEDEDE